MLFTPISWKVTRAAGMTEGPRFLPIHGRSHRPYRPRRQVGVITLGITEIDQRIFGGVATGKAREPGRRQDRRRQSVPHSWRRCGRWNKVCRSEGMGVHHPVGPGIVFIRDRPAVGVDDDIPYVEILEISASTREIFFG